ncbi:CvpA family protein [Planctomicrobium sp. SH527]|uniref:CvpA family protein n=1 Tax=Planctomicrobium sp. SH527 TaxID=3448123 RepID=UPI003F5C838E
MIDILMFLVMALVVWLVATDGPTGAGITFVALIISGLIAINFFEPLSNTLSTAVLLPPEWQVRWDIISFWSILSLTLFLLRMLGEQLIPTYAEMIGPIYQGSKWAFGVLTAYTFIGLVYFSLHIAPLPREFLGFTAESHNLFGMAPDRQWLGFAQYASENSLSRTRADGRPVIFDGAEYPSNPANLKTMQIWSSFPIRYGTRRQQYAAGGTAATQATPTSIAPPPSAQPSPSKNPNSGTGGF